VIALSVIASGRNGGPALPHCSAYHRHRAASLAPRCLAVYDRCDSVGEPSQFSISKIGKNKDRQVVVNVPNQQRFKSLPKAVMIMNIIFTLSLQLPCKSIRGLKASAAERFSTSSRR
jgi:hypothetical protein